MAAPKKGKGMLECLPVTCATTACEILRLARKALISSFITLLSLLPKLGSWGGKEEKKNKERKLDPRRRLVYWGRGAWVGGLE